MRIRGNPIYEYHTKSEPREAELRALGQTFRFVPPEGGVANVVVDSLSVSAKHITFGLLLSHEKTSAYGSEATLSQGQTNVVRGKQAGQQEQLWHRALSGKLLNF